MEKTNVMRILDQKKIVYKAHEYGDTGAISGKNFTATNESLNLLKKKEGSLSGIALFLFYKAAYLCSRYQR